MTYTTLADLFKGICDSIRAIFGTTDSIVHQNIPSKLDEIKTELAEQETLINEISALLDEKCVG